MNDTLQRNIEAALIGVGGVPLDGIDVQLEERHKEHLKAANAKGNYTAL